MYLKLGRVRLHIPLLFAAFLAAAADMGRRRLVLTVFFSAALHECGHLCYLLMKGRRDLTLSLLPGGAAISGARLETLSCRETLAAAAAGPAVNLALWAACAAPGGRFAEAARVNLLLAAVNLLPLSFLDGGRILHSLLLLRRPAAAEPIADAADRICLVLLVLFCVGHAVWRHSLGPETVFGVYCVAREGGEMIKEKMIKDKR